MLGVDSDELAEADFGAGNIAKNEAELPNEELDLFARALESIGMVPHAFGRRAREWLTVPPDRRLLCARCWDSQEAQRLAIAASALNGFGTFYQNCAQRAVKGKIRGCVMWCMGTRGPFSGKPSLKKQVSGQEI